MRAKRLESPGTNVSNVAFLFKCVSGSNAGPRSPLSNDCDGIMAGMGSWPWTEVLPAYGSKADGTSGVRSSCRTGLACGRSGCAAGRSSMAGAILNAGNISCPEAIRSAFINDSLSVVCRVCWTSALLTHSTMVVPNTASGTTSSNHPFSRADSVLLWRTASASDQMSAACVAAGLIVVSATRVPFLIAACC